MAAALCLAAWPLVGSCSSGPTGFEARITEIEGLTRDRFYVEAAEASVQLMQDTPADSPDRGQVVEVQRAVSLASQLENARVLSLAGDDEKALVILTRLAEQYPSTSQVDGWLKRTRRNLAAQWFSEAREAQANENFDEARGAYHRAIEFDADHPVAGLALEDLQILEDYRAELGADYYSGGIRGVVDHRLNEARSGFEKSLKYASGNERAERRIHEVDRELSMERAASAQALLDQHLYGAAALEFKAACDQNPESKELQAKLELARAEAKASILKGKAEFQMLRGEVDRAEELLTEGAALTTLQKDSFETVSLALDDARTDLLYQAALDLEHDFQFPKAIVAYKGILEGRDFYKDTRARVDALEGYVVEAERLYVAARAEGDKVERLKLLQEIEVFWPEYRDVGEKIYALKR